MKVGIIPDTRNVPVSFSSVRAVLGIYRNKKELNCHQDGLPLCPGHVCFWFLCPIPFLLNLFIYLWCVFWTELLSINKFIHEVHYKLHSFQAKCHEWQFDREHFENNVRGVAPWKVYLFLTPTTLGTAGERSCHSITGIAAPYNSNTVLVACCSTGFGWEQGRTNNLVECGSACAAFVMLVTVGYRCLNKHMFHGSPCIMPGSWNSLQMDGNSKSHHLLMSIHLFIPPLWLTYPLCTLVLLLPIIWYSATQPFMKPSCMSDNSNSWQHNQTCHSTCI